MTDFAVTARGYADMLLQRAIYVIAATALVAAASPAAFYLFGSDPAKSVWVAVLFLAAIAAGLATLALSAYLLFDAVLFRLIASYRSEADGAAAVDALLARAGLRALPEAQRPLADRMAGTRRIVFGQQTAFGAFLALAFMLGIAVL